MGWVSHHTSASGQLIAASATAAVGLGFGSIVVGFGVLLPNLGVGPSASTPLSAAVGAVVLGASFVGAYRLIRERSWAAPAGTAPKSQVSDSILHRTLLGGALSILTATVVFPMAVDQSPDLLERLIVRGLLWCGLGLAILQSVRSRRSAGRVDAGPVLLIALASMLLAAAATAVFDRSLSPAVELLTVPLAVVAALGVVVVPALLISSAVTGLQDVHDVTRGLTRLSVDRPRTVLLVLVANLVLVALIWGVGSALNPAISLWDSRPAGWLAAAICAALIIVMLTVERRIVLRAADNSTIAFAAGLVVAAPIAALMLVYFGVFVFGVALDHPLSLAGLALLVVGVVTLQRLVHRNVVLLLAVAALGIVVAALGSVPSPSLPVAVALRALSQDSARNFGVTVVLAISALVLALIGVILAACLFRQARLLIYLAAVGGWVLVTLLLKRWTGVTALNLDVALTVLLMLATVFWLTGRQRAIDGYEVVLTVVVTASLWLVPLALRLVPDPIDDWLVAGALLLPAASSLRTHLRDRKRSGPRAAGGQLGLTCLMYGLLAALVWVIGAGQVTLSENVATAVSEYVLLPLGLLLILTASAGRAPLTSFRLTGPSTAGSGP